MILYKLKIEQELAYFCDLLKYLAERAETREKRKSKNITRIDLILKDEDLQSFQNLVGFFGRKVLE